MLRPNQAVWHLMWECSNFFQLLLVMQSQFLRLTMNMRTKILRPTLSYHC